MGRKKLVFLLLTLMIAIAFLEVPAFAWETTLGGKPLRVYGFLTQGMSFTPKDRYDTEDGLNSAIWSLLVEGEYMPADELKIFSQFMLTGDWVYNIKNSTDSWEAKEFDESRSELGLDDEYWQIVKELYGFSGY